MGGRQIRATPVNFQNGDKPLTPTISICQYRFQEITGGCGLLRVSAARVIGDAHEHFRK